MSSNNNNKSSGAASGGELEEKLDLSEECNKKIEQAKSMVESSSSSIKDALLLLSGFEKRCRVGNDTTSLVKVCQTSLDLCYGHSDDNYELLIYTLETLANKRSQKSQAIKSLVTKCLPWCLDNEGNSNYPIVVVPTNDTTEIEKRNSLVKSLRDITDGKIFLEKERSQLTRALSYIYENQGKIVDAANILQEVHVETYGSLSKKEKIEFILEQMRLTLLKRDYVRAAIVSNKIRTSHLLEDGMEYYKVKFYILMSQYHIQCRDTLELAKDYYNIYKTPKLISDDNDKWQKALTLTILFLSLSPYGLEQQDLLNRINTDISTKEQLLPSVKTLIDLMLTKEIINYPLPNDIQKTLVDEFVPKTIYSSCLSMFISNNEQKKYEGYPTTTSDENMKDMSTTDATTSPADDDTEDLTEHWHTLFHQRIIQHNIRIVSLYYKRIHGKRLCKLLNLTPDKLEDEISLMVSTGQVYVKIDRPADIIRFTSTKTPEEVLSSWSSDIDNLLYLVDSTTHLIHKENMMTMSTK